MRKLRDRISFRYFGVELLTGLLFLAVWLKVWPDEWLLAFPYWVLVSLFIVATFIDFEFFIIPDEITWGGASLVRC
jgi:leader peptidase (prepilin peptidase)/N-methyltransferase